MDKIEFALARFNAKPAGILEKTARDVVIGNNSLAVAELLRQRRGDAYDPVGEQREAFFNAIGHQLDDWFNPGRKPVSNQH